MLMGVVLGVLPSNLTTPLRVAVEVGGPPAFTAGWLDMKITTVKVAIRVRLFVVIRTNFLPWRLGVDFSSFGSSLRSQEGALSFRGHCPIILVLISCQDDLTIKRSAAVEKGRVNGTLQRLLDRWSARGRERFWRIKETTMAESSVGECFCLQFELSARDSASGVPSRSGRTPSRFGCPATSFDTFETSAQIDSLRRVLCRSGLD